MCRCQIGGSKKVVWLRWPERRAGVSSGEAGKPHVLSSVFSLYPEGSRRVSKTFKQRGSGWIRIAAQRTVAVMTVRHVHGQCWMQRGLVTICKKCVGCVDVLVTMLWPVMCTEWRLTYKNQLLKA